MDTKAGFLDNLRGNILCAIDVETTGTVPGEHDIIQLAILPLDSNMKPCPKQSPFIMDIKPKRPENVQSEAMRINRLKLCDIMVRGCDPYKAEELLVEWFYGLKLGYQRRIVPVGANYAFDRGFLIEFLGPLSYDMIFDSAFRDVLSCANFINDRDGWFGRGTSYRTVNLSGLCATFKIERTRAHDATDDARVTAEVYRRLVQELL